MNQSATLRRPTGFACGFLLFLCLALVGCEPQLDPEQYGKVVYELPKVEDANLPYPLPQLEELPQEPAASPPAERATPAK